MISRRQVVGTSSLAVLGLLSGFAFAEAGDKVPASKVRRDTPQRTETPMLFIERLQNAGSVQERQQIMSEQITWQRQRAFEDLKVPLRLSDQEWSVVKPRRQRVHDLARPRPPVGGKGGRPKTEVEQRSRELSELLRDEKAEVSQIKARLTALRAAKERTVQELIKARQSLRQILTLRQEAMLVLNGLLE
jgi:hypothetical protein